MKVTKLLLAAVFAAAAPAALAIDAFTISVPVDFKSLNSSVSAVRIRCSLQMRDAVTGTPMAFGPAAGKSADLPVTGGNYTGPSPLVFVFRTEDFSAAEQATLSSVTGGRCWFNLITPTGQYIPYGGETTPVLAQRPGTPFRSQVTFTFP